MLILVSQSNYKVNFSHLFAQYNNNNIFHWYFHFFFSVEYAKNEGVDLRCISDAFADYLAKK